MPRVLFKRREQSHKFTNIVGKRYGYLTVVEHTGWNGKHSEWRVRCVCGKELIKSRHRLKNGENPSCGCQNTKEKRQYWANYARTCVKVRATQADSAGFTDLTGYTIGWVKVLKLAGFAPAIGNGKQYMRSNWLVKCKCGNEAVRTRKQINDRKGRVIVSCGCRNTAKALSERAKKQRKREKLTVHERRMTLSWTPAERAKVCTMCKKFNRYLYSPCKVKKESDEQRDITRIYKRTRLCEPCARRWIQPDHSVWEGAAKRDLLEETFY